jgi:DNA-binding response OmpR family regulator
MKKILLVEDEEHLRVLMKEELADAGYEVMTASDGVEALSMIHNKDISKPDLIILDIHMPKMDGFETMGHLLKSSNDSPIIIHSGYAGYKVHPLTIAADAYIVKSHDLTVLKTAISRLLRIRISVCERSGEQALDTFR